jgi:hypothetical protein
MHLSETTVQIVIFVFLFIFLVAIGWLLAEYRGMKEEIMERMGYSNEPLKLQLQAYERLTLYAERSALKNLVARTTTAGLTVVDMQLLLLDTLRSEYEYNVSQQIYIGEDMWKAVGNLKDQNIYIINQLAATLPSQGNGIELSKRILEYAATANSDLSSIVLEALRYEAKKLL